MVSRGQAEVVRLCFNAHGFLPSVVDVWLTPADGACERDATLGMMAGQPSIRDLPSKKSIRDQC